MHHFLKGYSNKPASLPAITVDGNFPKFAQINPIINLKLQPSFPLKFSAHKVYFQSLKGILHYYTDFCKLEQFGVFHVRNVSVLLV